MRFFQKHIYSLIIVILVIGSMWPTFYELSRANDVHSDRQFELIHNYYTDYNFYLSRIRQGIEGNLLVHEKYTSEPHQGSLFQIVYLAMGWVGDFLTVPWDRPGDIYHAARFVFAFAVLALIAEFAKDTLGKLRVPKENLIGGLAGWTLIGFLLAVTASTWPKLVLQFDGWRFGGYMSWFTVMDSLQRITFLPHLLIGQAIMMFLLLAIASRETLERPGNWVFLGFMGLLLTLIYPPGLVVVAVAAGYLWIFDKIFWPRVVIGAMSLPVIIYIFLMATIYPWKRLVEFDILNPIAFNLWEYILAMGPVLPLGIIGLVVALLKKETALKSVMAWILAFFTIFFGFHFVPQQHPIRFAETLPHVPLAILTAYLFAQISAVSFRVVRVRIRLGTAAYIIPIVVILLGVGTMYSSWLWQRDFTDHKLIATYPLVPSGSYVMYPLRDFIAGMTYLRGSTSRDSVVLSMQTTGNYIPVYAGNTVYFGHSNTVKYEEKKLLVVSFFGGTMNATDAAAWIREAGIAYVFFGPQEQEVDKISKLETVYPFLHPVFTNHYVTIYRVIE